MIRVIQWYTGRIARRQIRRLITDPRFELVGVVTSTPEKDGVDAGTLAGLDEVGVAATTDADAALALDADCILYNPPFWDGDLVERMLRAGKNVVSPAGGFDLRAVGEQERMDAAGTAGGVSVTGAGNMPGLLNDVVPLLLSGYTSDVRGVATVERNLHRDYPDAGVLAMLGFGAPLEECAADSPRGQMMSQALHWYERQAAHLVATTLGHELEDLRVTRWDLLAAPAPIHLAASGLTIAEGTVAGLRVELAGIVDGEPWHTTTIEHVADLGVAPGWQQSEQDPELEIRVLGTPDLSVTFGPLGVEGMLELNASRVVNTIAPLCAAAPGAATILDLPFVHSTGVRAGRATTRA